MPEKEVEVEVKEAEKKPEPLSRRDSIVSAVDVAIKEKRRLLIFAVDPGSLKVIVNEMASLFEGVKIAEVFLNDVLGRGQK